MKTVGAYEAKTHLPKLLERVARGETITITKHGVPVAILAPPEDERRPRAEEAIAALRTFRERFRGRGLTAEEVKALKHSGHKY